MAGHSVAANLVMVICLVGGIMALRGMKKEIFPDIEPDMVSISVPYPGASPEEVVSIHLISVLQPRAMAECSMALIIEA